MANYLVEIKDMYKIYKMGDNVVNAINGITLNINAHEFTTIIGPSGSGKSTFMNMIGCLDTPTSGSYYLDGIEVSTLNENQLADIRNHKIGFIFQSFNLLQKLSSFENVELPLIYQGVSAKERHQRSMKALEMVGLGGRMDHKPYELSGGQQQRVAIARALVTNPPIILADEPTGNLDSKSGKDVMAILKGLHSNGNTIILITHDNGVAKQGERIIRIQDGQLVEDKEGES